MHSVLVIYGVFFFGCIAGLFRPWIGLAVFYGFATLEPTWNWRWVMDNSFPFQKYLFVFSAAGFLVTGFHTNRLYGVLRIANYCLLAFLALAFISAQSSIAPWLTGPYMETLWKIIAVAVITGWILNSKEQVVTLMWIAAICQGYNALQINLQYLSDGYCRYATASQWGTKGDNNVYSIFTLPVMAIVLGLIMHSPKRWQQGIAGLIFLLQAHQIMLLESRGTMIGTIVMVTLFILIIPKNATRLTGIVLGVTLVGILAGPPVIKEFSSSFKTGDELDSSAGSRYELWKAGTKITADYPLLGVGPFAGQLIVPNYFLGSDRKDRKGLHNLFFEISTGCGLPATFLYLTYFLLPWLVILATYLRERRTISDWAGASFVAVGCGVPGYWVASMFSSGALMETSYLLVAIGLGTFAVHTRRCEDDEEVVQDVDLPAVSRVAYRPGYISVSESG